MFSVVLPCIEGQLRRLIVSALLLCVWKGSYQGEFPDISKWTKAMLFGHGEVQRYRNFDDMRRSGRPKATTAVDDRYVRISARRNRESNATMLNNAFCAATGRRDLTQTVQNRLHDAQLHSRHPW